MAFADRLLCVPAIGLHLSDERRVQMPVCLVQLQAALMELTSDLEAVRQQQVFGREVLGPYALKIVHG
jgi:hypothetical protein